MASIAGGAWLELIAEKEVSDGVFDPPIKLALATGADYDEDFDVQPLNTLGHLGPQEFNSFGYSCTINMQMLVAKDKVLFNKIIPNRIDVQLNGQLAKWRITFRSTTSDATIYAQFKGVVIANNGQQIATNQFVTANCRMMAIERVKDPNETGGQSGFDATIPVTP